MRAVIIGAGRGSRLQQETDHQPKTLVPVMGRPMLDWIVDALREAGFHARDIVFISGYAEEVVRARYPDFEYVRNHQWQDNNILHSLMFARDLLREGFVSTYADIVYEADVVKRLKSSPHDLVLGCDTHWRRRYVARSQHPESDAEKLRAKGDRVVQVDRTIPSDQADGEFIGVLKATSSGAQSLIAAFDEIDTQNLQGEWRQGRTFKRAYLIDLLQTMLENQVPMYRENTPGGYMEIDTLEDLHLAERWWNERP